MTTGFWGDRPVLLTGATGLLGAWLAHRLLDEGADLVCLVRDWVPQSELMRTGQIERVKVVRGDVRDVVTVGRVVGEYEIETVIHLAAQTIVGIANGNPIETLETNIMGTWSVLEACRRHGKVGQILIASSDKAYGEQEHLPYTEEMALRGRHPYDVSKSCADLLALAFAHSYGLPIVIARCANLYGGGDLNWNRLIPGTIRAVLRGQRPVIRSDGSYVRDYLYVEDAAAAYIVLAESLADRPQLSGEAFNFSHENPLSVLQVVTSILSLMECDLQPLILNRATNEIREQYLSTAKARRLLGWSPLHTMEEGLTSTIRWYEQLLGATADPHA